VSAEITAAPSPTLRCPTKFNAKYIKRAWEIVARDGAPREVRILKTERDGTVSGIFTDPEQVAAAIASWDGVKSIYLTVNPLKPEMLARENVGKLTRWSKDTTADHDIASREWFIIDIDPVTPVKHVSATEEEQARAIEVRDHLAEWLTEAYGFPPPIRGRSGNGGRLLYAIALPNDEASTDLIKRCLQALALHWNVPQQVEIDTSVFNASRVDKVWGTMAVKGSSTDERPHRRAYLDVVPAEILLVLREQLDQLAALAPAKPTRTMRAPSADVGRDFPELLAAIQAQGLYLKQVGEDHFIVCPWKAEHSVESGASETKLFEPSAANGYAGGFRYQHSHCTERRISDVYKLFIEPVLCPTLATSTAATGDEEDRPGGERFTDREHARLFEAFSIGEVRHADEMGERWYHVGPLRWSLDFKMAIVPYVQRVVNHFFACSNQHHATADERYEHFMQSIQQTKGAES
jgi:hypothetical protein